MKTNPYDKNRQKFNKSTSALSNWPFKSIRFDTRKHPVIQSDESCSNRLTSMWSQQEELIVKGISNSLQSQAREAVRIALYETCLSPQDAYKKAFIYADKMTKERGHTSRDREHGLALPKSEKDKVVAAAKGLGISDKEFLRLAVIWVAMSIKDDSIKLTNTKQINQLDLRQEWSKRNQGKPSTIKPLLDAQKKGIAKSEEEQYEKDKEYEKQEELIKLLRTEDRNLSWEAAEILIREELNEIDPFEEMIREEVEKLDLDEREANVIRYMAMGFSEQEAELAVQEDQETEEEKPLTEEEEATIMKELEEMLEEMRSLDPPNKERQPLRLRTPRQPTEQEKTEELKKSIERMEHRLEVCNPKVEADQRRILEDEKRRYRIRTFFDELI